MSSDKTVEKAAPTDKDLDDLLDSALEDFDKPAPKPATTAASSGTASATGESAEKDLLAGAKPPRDEEWNEEFLNQAKFFEEQMAALFGGAGAGASGEAVNLGDQFNVGFEKLAEAAQRAASGEEVGNVDATYVDHITQALKGLKDGSESISASNPLDNMGDMLSGLNLNDLGGEDANNPFMPFVQGMMHSLLSAEVLLPSLRELLEKYPVWLAENEATVDAADKERYMKQQELFKVICADLEQERPDDAADVKAERFKKVLANMQKLHEYGQPPAELVGSDDTMAGMPGFGAGMPGMPGLSGMPGMPGAGAGAMNDPSQCALM